MTISPDRILKELAELWVHEGQAGSGASVLRACTMTLIVIAEESEDAAEIGETIAALMPEHPARAVLVRLCGKQARELSERVYAQCWMPFGQRRQICCEQVEIVAADAALADLPSVVLPLAVADLPVMLWCRTPRLLGMPEFAEMAGMATKVVVNSAMMPDARAALRRIAGAGARGTVIADLAWTRLTRWREMLSHVFENRERLEFVGGAVVEFGAGWETSARYMASWIGGALGSEVEVRQGNAPMRIELSGADLRVELAKHDGTLIVNVNDVTHQMHLPPASDYLLMREEMSIVRRDRVFERTLEAAAK